MERFDSGVFTVDAAASREASGSKRISIGILAALAALMLGGLILFMVGFAPNDFVHAAAHDVRHAIGFPCH